jgi:hypothetical protein
MLDCLSINDCKCDVLNSIAEKLGFLVNFKIEDPFICAKWRGHIRNVTKLEPIELIIKRHFSRACQCEFDLDELIPSSTNQLDASVEKHMQFIVISDVSIDDSWIIVPVPAPVVPVTSAVFAGPAWLNLAVCVAAIACCKVTVVTFVPEEI